MRIKIALAETMLESRNNNASVLLHLRRSQTTCSEQIVGDVLQDTYPRARHTVPEATPKPSDFVWQTSERSIRVRTLL